MLTLEAAESELRERLTAILCATTPLMRVLSVARGLCLPDWLVFSGAVYQPVVHHLTARALDYGIEVDPVWWSLSVFQRRLHRCPRHVRHTHPNFAVKWLTWS